MAAVAEEMAVAVGGVAPRVEVAAVVVGAPLARTRPARHRQPKAKQEEEEHAALERGVNHATRRVRATLITVPMVIVIVSYCESYCQLH